MRDGPASLAQPHQAVHQALGAAQHGQVASDANVCFWHNRDLHRTRFIGLPTSILPTLGAECELIATFQTRIRGMLNAYSWRNAELTGTKFLPLIRAGHLHGRNQETRAAPVPREGVKRPPPWTGVGRSGRLIGPAALAAVIPAKAGTSGKSP